MNRIVPDGSMEFSRSLIEGVEIKLCRNDPHLYKPHVHNELALGYILEGSTDLTLNDKTVRYKAGDGIIIPPLMTHLCAPNNIKKWVYIMLFIDPSYYGDMIRFHQPKKLKQDEVERLKVFIEQLLYEGKHDALETMLIELLLELAENHDVTDSAVVDDAELSTLDTEEKMRVVHDYLMKQVRNTVTLKDLEQLSGLNKFSIIRNFKKMYFATPRPIIYSIELQKRKDY